MADQNSRVETVIATGIGAQGQFGAGEEAPIKSGPEAGIELELGVDPNEEEADETVTAPETPEGDKPDADAAEGADDKAEGDKPDDAEGPAVDLGDFDPESEEVVAKYDAKYFHEVDGVQQIKLEAFNAELAANLAKETPVADINKGTRDYLKSTLGLSDDAITSHIAGVMALREKAEAEVYSGFGGKESYEAAFEWGVANYTEAQKARFNAAKEKGGEEFQEQLELLKVRAAGKVAPKADGEAGAEKKPGIKGPPGKRAASPARDVTKNAVEGGGNGPAIEPFATSEDHRKAQNEAIASGDPKEIAKVRARLKASPRLWQGNK